MQDLPLMQKKFRTEIEGLRVLCIALIIIYHIWIQKVSGGIDVFFVLTGYFTMLSMLYTLQYKKKISILHIVSKSISKLWLHAAFVAIMTMLMIAMLYPPAQWQSNLQHMLSSVFYMENWYLIKNSTNYAAFDQAASPFQHYWSLAIQWQYTIAMAFIVMLLHAASKLFKLPYRKVVLAVLVVGMLSSFAYSLYMLAMKPEAAYFHSLTRAWELWVGAIVALMLPVVRLTKAASVVVTLVAILLIILTGIVLPADAQFPGFAALLPVIGAALFIMATAYYQNFMTRFLSSVPLRWLSRYVYGLFLWHWPVLMTAKLYWQTNALTLQQGLIVIGVSLLFAIASHTIIRGFEQHSTPIMIGIACIVISVNIVGNQYIDYMQKQTAEQPMIESDYPGAKVLTENARASSNMPLMPSDINVRYDVPLEFENQKCKATTAIVKRCSFGEVDNPDFTMALIGGSHSVHWFPALEPLTKSLNFQLDSYIFDGCRFTNDNFNGQMTDECLVWNDYVLEQLIANPPDYIFTTATLNKHPKIPSGYLEQWRKLEGISQIIAVTDNPRMPHDVPSCLEINRSAIENCNVPRSEVLPEQHPWEVTDNIPNNVSFIDMNDAFCDQDTCYAVAGNIVAYRDNNHLTATYMNTVASYLYEPLKNIVTRKED